MGATSPSSGDLDMALAGGDRSAANAGEMEFMQPQYHATAAAAADYHQLPSSSSSSTIGASGVSASLSSVTSNPWISLPPTGPADAVQRQLPHLSQQHTIQKDMISLYEWHAPPTGGSSLQNHYDMNDMLYPANQAQHQSALRRESSSLPIHTHHMHGDRNVDTLASDDLVKFANEFRLRRLKLGYRQADVSFALKAVYGISISKTVISHFEGFLLKRESVCRVKPWLQKWLERVDKTGSTTSIDKIAAQGRKRTSIDDSVEGPLEQHFHKQPRLSNQEITTNPSSSSTMITNVMLHQSYLAAAGATAMYIDPTHSQALQHSSSQHHHLQQTQASAGGNSASCVLQASSSVSALDGSGASSMHYLDFNQHNQQHGPNTLSSYNVMSPQRPLGSTNYNNDNEYLSQVEQQQPSSCMFSDPMRYHNPAPHPHQFYTSDQPLQHSSQHLQQPQASSSASALGGSGASSMHHLNLNPQSLQHHHNPQQQHQQHGPDILSSSATMTTNIMPPQRPLGSTHSNYDNEQLSQVEQQQEASSIAADATATAFDVTYQKP